MTQSFMKFGHNSFTVHEVVLRLYYVEDRKEATGGDRLATGGDRRRPDPLTDVAKLFDWLN